MGNKIQEGLTFDDILLVPGKSEILPSEVDVSVRFSRNVQLQIPLLSAAMDTVTEAPMAIGLAQHGGLGVIHKNMSIESQCAEVQSVKRFESGMISDPITLSPAAKLREALDLMQRYRISGIPITDEDGTLRGIITHRHLRFETQLDVSVSQLMTSENLVTAPIGTTLEEAKTILHRHRIEKLPVVDDDFRLSGLITVKDIQKKMEYPHGSKDDMGRLRAAAAVGVSGAERERAEALVQASVDVLVVDVAHAHTRGVLEMVRSLREQFPDVELVAGNVATREGVEALVQLGVDAVKVGVGPGSICTTRVIAGIGVPQLTAIEECARATRTTDVPLIADGVVKYSGDITKALAAGADTVMIGSLFAGTEESPGEIITFQGRTFKAYRGMGSLGAMKAGSSDRYFQAEEDEIKRLVPEGVEGRVPYRGSLSSIVPQLVGGLRAGMGYCGCGTIQELHEKATFMRITQAGLKEGHPHDVIITKEAPNYSFDDRADLKKGGW